jgi:8-oxo-dGTP pyrophosphatase MutT (NUDIX family)
MNEPLILNGASFWRPDVTVAAVVEENGRFLFVEERVRGQLVLNQPAGHLEAGESLIEAVCRETLEESAWEIEATHLVGVYQWTSPRDGVAFMRFAFAARALCQHDRALDQGIERAVWLSADELTRHDVPRRSPLVEACVRDHIDGHRYSFEVFRNLDAHLLKRA